MDTGKTRNSHANGARESTLSGPMRLVGLILTLAGASTAAYIAVTRDEPMESPVLFVGLGIFLNGLAGTFPGLPGWVAFALRIGATGCFGVWGLIMGDII